MRANAEGGDTLAGSAREVVPECFRIAAETPGGRGMPVGTRKRHPGGTD